MFKAIGFASALVLSSLLAAPFAMAEESSAFVARNDAIHANFEQHEEALAARAREQDKTRQASTYNPQTENTKHT
jgi:Ni/Co efflux regulator RcnB